MYNPSLRLCEGKIKKGKERVIITNDFASIAFIVIMPEQVLEFVKY